MLMIEFRRVAIAAAVALSAATAANAQPGGGGGGGARGNAPPIDQAAGPVAMKPTLSARGAQTMIDAIAAAAVAKRQGVSVAIVDSGGNLLAFKRMDGADLGSADAAMRKAVSALKLQSPTGAFQGMFTSNPALAQGFVSAGFTLLGGGEPIRLNGQVVGAIAVSGTGDDGYYDEIGLKALAP